MPLPYGLTHPNHALTTVCAALNTNAEARKSPLSPKKKGPKLALGSPRGPGKAEIPDSRHV